MKQEINGAPALHKRNKLLWSLVAALLAAATVWAVVSQSRSFSFAAFAEYVAGARRGWLLLAAGCMLLYIWFEGRAVAVLCRAFGYRETAGHGVVYSAADIYCSAITPSATGGQPACAWFMVKNGIPMSVTTLVLLLNLTFYTVAILIIGLVALVLRPGVFLAFSTLGRVLVALGYLVQGGLTAGLLLLLFRGQLLHRICRGGLRLLCRLRLVRGEEEKLRRLEAYMADYRACAERFRRNRSAMARAMALNLLQRLSLLLVSAFVFMAAGGRGGLFGHIFAVQCYTVIGSNAIPIPGAMGVSDYLLLEGFGRYMDSAAAVQLELLCRTISFYSCVLLCGLVVLAALWRFRKRGCKH